MLREIRQVLRLVVLMGKERQPHVLKTAGGLLVLLWTETKAPQRLNCTVVSELKKGSFLGVWPCPEPDPEELSAFTDLYGSLRLLLSFQMNDAGHLSSECQAHIEAFFKTFSLTNAGIKIHLKLKFNEQTSQREFRVKVKRKISLADQPPLILDASHSAQPPRVVKKGCWCQAVHPVVGGRVPLSIPPQAMDRGLFGELSVQMVTLLSPCVLQYPNLLTELRHIQVLVYSPSNIPLPGPSGFFQTIAASLDCQQLGVHKLYCSSLKDLVQSSGTVYTVEQENREGAEQESSQPLVQQHLRLFLFLQHRDPFVSQINDLMAAEVLIENHLEDILRNNRRAMTTALQTELGNTLKAQNHRKQQQRKLRSGAEVILTSTMSIVSCSSDMDFRNTCLNRMKVRDTHELQASLRESLWKVTSWKFIPMGRCCHAQQVEAHLESNEPTRTEI
ncbi:type 2 DNA topoisomerase 6 subunit B-like [Xenentodon cancila]